MSTSLQSDKKAFRSALPSVIFTAFMFFLVYISRSVFGPLLPQIEAEFSVSHTESTQCLLFMGIGYSLSILLSAMVAPIIKARYLVGIAVVMAGVTLLLMANITEWWLFSAMFGALGFMAGQYFNGGLSVLRNLVPSSQFSYAISIHEFGPGLSFIIAPLLVRFEADGMGWREGLMLTGATCILFGAFYCFFSKGGLQTSDRLSFAGIKKIALNKKVWILGWILGLAIAGEFAPFSIMTLYLTKDRLMDNHTANTLLSASRFIAPIAVLGGGWVTNRFGCKRALLGCFFLLGISICMISASSSILMITGLFIHPIVTALIFPPSFALMVKLFSANDQALVLSLSMPMAGIIGTGIMPAILGYFGDSFTFSLGFIVVGCIFLLTMPLVMSISKD